MRKLALLVILSILGSFNLHADRTRSHPVRCRDYKFDMGHFRCKAAACNAAGMNAMESCVKAGHSKYKVLQTQNDPYYVEGKAYVVCDMIYQCKPEVKK